MRELQEGVRLRLAVALQGKVNNPNIKTLRDEVRKSSACDPTDLQTYATMVGQEDTDDYLELLGLLS